jgi:hypothetical protein
LKVTEQVKGNRSIDEMQYFTHALLLLSTCARLLNALPTVDASASLEPRCGSFLAPDGFFLLKEDDPNAWLPVNNNLFQVAQKAGANWGRATGRQYLLVHFPATPHGSYGCELHWNIPQNTQFLTYYGTHQLDVKKTTAYFPPFRPTWNSVIAGDPSTLGPGVFGTCNAVQGASSVINTAACSNGGQGGAPGGGFGLGFVFKFADWVEQGGQAAGASFYAGWTGPAGVFKGPYLNYNC